MWSSTRGSPYPFPGLPTFLSEVPSFDNLLTVLPISPQGVTLEGPFSMWGRTNTSLGTLPGYLLESLVSVQVQESVPTRF